MSRLKNPAATFGLSAGLLLLFACSGPATQGPPSPVPPRVAWGLPSSCPSSDGLHPVSADGGTGALRAVTDFVLARDAKTLRSLSDPAYWPAIPASVSPSGRTQLTSADVMSAPATEAPQSDLISRACGDTVLKSSWWIAICAGSPASECLRRSPALLENLYLINRGGLWLVWMTFP